MSSCKSSPTLADTKSKTSATNIVPYEDLSLYRSLVRALQYLTFTRPDISYAVQQTCLFMHNPMEAHMHALRRILRYIHGTGNYVLHLYPSFITSLISYIHVDRGGCPNTRRFISGYYVFLGDNLLSWSSKRQPTLSHSSAEYCGIANVVSESCQLQNILLELDCHAHKATMVYCDNISVIYLSGNPVEQHQRTKHIEIDIHFVCEMVSRGQVCVLHISSQHQIVHIFLPNIFPHLILRFQRQSQYSSNSHFDYE